jgi:K+-transporting ATPase ATPase A chain
MPAWVYIGLCLLLVVGCMVPLGSYMAKVYSGERNWLSPVLGWLELLIYRLCGIDPKDEMSWRSYAAAVLIFGCIGFLLFFIILSFQHTLPLNPQGFDNLSAALAFNVAIAFVTNTDWQSYSGETSLSYLSQMVGCGVQNFISAATGLAVAMALFRGLARKQTQHIGNFWADIVRGIVYILLPMSFVFALVLVSQGVIQNLHAYTPYSGLEKNAADLIAQGPVASQVAIKMLGSNGGGFFGAGGAHPFENPTPLSNMLQMIAILLIPVSTLYTFGIMVGDRRQSWMLLMAMSAVLLPLLFMTVAAEKFPNPRLPAAIDQAVGNMEGKEQRIGVEASAVWAIMTTATSNGSTNSAHNSFMPLAGMGPMLLMQFGEVIFGGVGAGIYSMLMYVLITVFIGGLMVGRSPEYLGKKLGVQEIKIALLIIIIPPTMALFGAALAVATDVGRAAVLNPGAQGLSEVLYNFASVSNNNGSAFAGFNPQSTFYHVAFGLCMVIGRYALIVLALIISGTLAAKNTTPVSAGTLPTHTPLFAFLLVSVILLNALTYIPSVALGPVAEHIHLHLPAGEQP